MSHNTFIMEEAALELPDILLEEQSLRSSKKLPTAKGASAKRLGKWPETKLMLRWRPERVTIMPK